MYTGDGLWFRMCDDWQLAVDEGLLMSDD